MPTIADLIVKYSADTKDAEAGSDRVNSKISGATKLALAAGTAVGGFLAGSVFAAANFEQAMDGVSASLGGVGTAGGITADQFQRLQDEALRIGQTTSVGATDAARAMDLLGKAGVDVEAIYSGVAQGVVNVSEATGESIEQSASSFGTLNNMFKDTGISASQMSDTIVNAMNASDMTLSEFQTGVARLSPVIAATGMSFQDSAAAIAYFNAQGFSAAEVGTSLTAAFNNLVAPTTTQAAAMERLGISAFDAQGQFIGFPEIFDQVAAATAGMTEETRAATIAELFGADARDLMTKASLEGGDALREYTDLMEESGTAATASATRMDNLKGDIEQLRGAMETLMIRVGSAMLPFLRNITQGLTGLVEEFMAFGDTVSDLMDAGLNPLEAILTALSGTFDGLGLDTIADGFQRLADLAGDLGPAISDVVDAFQALLAGDVSGFFDELQEAADTAFAALQNFASVTLDWVLDTGIPTVIGWVADNAGNVWEGIKSLVGWAWDNAVDLGTILLSAALDVAGELATWAGNIWGWIRNRLGADKPTKNVPMGTVLIDAILDAAGDLATWAGNIWGWIQNKLGADKPTKTLPLGTVVVEAAFDFGAMIGAATADFTAAVRGVDWAGLYAAAFAANFNIGERLGEIVNRAISSISWGSVIDFAVPAAKIMALFGLAIVAAPFVIAGLGLAVAAGFVQGLTGIDLSGAARGVMERFASALNSAISVLTRVWETLKREAQNAWTGISSVFTNIGNAFTTIRTAAGNAETAITDFATTVGEGLSGLWDAVSGSVQPLLDFLDDLISKAQEAADWLSKLPGVGGGSGGGQPSARAGIGDWPSGTFPGYMPSESGIGMTSGGALVSQLPNVGAGPQGFAAQIQAMARQVTAAISAMAAQAAAGMRQVVTQMTAALRPLAPQVQAIVTQTVTMFRTVMMQLPPQAMMIATQTRTMIQTALMPLPAIAMQIGTQTSQMFLAGFRPIQPQATAIAQQTRSSVTSALQSIVGPAQSAGSQAGQGFVSGFRAIQAATGVASGVVGSIRGILASASSGAFGYGAAVGNQFAAGIRSSLGAVAAAAAALRALMPSSPAKTGPLSKPISWQYIIDDLRRTMGLMGPTAERGMRDAAQAFARSGGLAVAGRYGGAGGQTIQIITLEPGRWAEFLRMAQNGNTAYQQVSPRGREIALGLRGA